MEQYLSPCTKHNSKQVQDRNIHLGLLNLIKEKVGNSLEVIGTGQGFSQLNTDNPGSKMNN